MDTKSNVRRLLLMIFDVIGANLAYGCALWLRFEGFDTIPENYLSAWLHMVPVLSILVLAVFLGFRLYKSIWEFASYLEVVRSFLACLILGLIYVPATLIFAERMPLSYYVFGWLLMFMVLTGIRLSYRTARVLRVKYCRKGKDLERVLIVGGGETGRALIREIRGLNPRVSEVICIADDAEEYAGKYLEGVPVEGRISEVPSLVEKYDIDRVIVAIPWAGARRQKEIISQVKSSRCKVVIMPRPADLADVESSLGKIRNIEIEDLLGRDSVVIDNSQVGRLLEGKTVLVTGGGGSIGSELVRQIASFKPGRLIIFDIYENSAYEIQQEIKSKYPGIDLKTIIGSIADEKTVRKIFEKYRPEMVYHAAAHKHVPLMEDVPCEAIKNNVTGTMNCARAAADFGTKRFILISTDKAVNPTNIMGASKRLCEMVVKAMNEETETEFVAVRFGNVLGSNGSVVPLFKKQINKGGPVTVTHPEITRFFMTIPEAVSLVLQSGAYAKGGELFVLDMGEPVKIDDLARNLIELAGLRPDVDIKIEYTGLRPGEKLYEEILLDEEGLRKTENELIFIGRQTETPEGFFDTLENLEKAAEERVEDMIERVAKIVGTYEPRRDNDIPFEGK